MQPEIIFEDQDLVLINKPAGWVVNAAESASGPILQEWMWQYLGKKASPPAAKWQSQVPSDFEDTYGSPEEIFAERQGMVHRLDKDTSGVMVWAKHPGSLVAMLAAFRERKIEKEYVCLVHGKFTVLADEVRLPIARSREDRKLFRADANGRPAITRYQVEAYYPNLDLDAAVKSMKQKGFSVQGNFKKRAHIYQGFSLVKCWPKTGRTHQIRVHMKELRHPLVGDTAYLGRKRAQLDPAWCSRQFLHAAQLSFSHPRTGQPVSFQAELTSDLAEALALLKLD